jgi:hypothetical protein
MLERGKNEEFLNREYALLRRVQSGALNFGSEHARRHLREGFARRLLLMQTNRLAMLAVAPLGRTHKLSSYECADLNVHLNSWYVQMRGALDNLSWALHYRWNLLGSSGENDEQVRRRCYLFARRFQVALQNVRPRLHARITSHADWARTFKELRDPIAHRVPIYAVPAVAFDPDKAEFDRLNKEANEAAARGDLDTVRSKMQEASTVGTYYHVVAMSGSGGIELRRLPPQLLLDAESFFAIGEAVIEDFETAA